MSEVIYILVTDESIEAFTDVDKYETRLVNFLRVQLGMPEVASDWTPGEFPEDRDEIEHMAQARGVIYQTAEFYVAHDGADPEKIG